MFRTAQVLPWLDLLSHKLLGFGAVMVHFILGFWHRTIKQLHQKQVAPELMSSQCPTRDWGSVSPPAWKFVQKHILFLCGPYASTWSGFINRTVTKAYSFPVWFTIIIRFDQYAQFVQFEDRFKFPMPAACHTETKILRFDCMTMLWWFEGCTPNSFGGFGVLHLCV